MAVSNPRDFAGDVQNFSYNELQWAPMNLGSMSSHTGLWITDCFEASSEAFMFMGMCTSMAQVAERYVNEMYQFESDDLPVVLRMLCSSCSRSAAPWLSETTSPLRLLTRLGFCISARLLGCT